MAALPLWHLALESDWRAAQQAGYYDVSTRGRTLAEEGFIHCSYPHQVGAVARAFYADLTEPLLILELDAGALRSAGTSIRVEEVPGGQRFPHLYGRIPVDAVVAVRPADFDPEGGFVVGDPEAQPRTE